MEIISCHAARFCYVVNFRGSKLPIAKEKGCFSVVIEPGFASSRYSHLYSLRLKRPGQCRPSTAVCSLNRYEHVVNSSVLSETYYSNVLGGEKGVSSLTDISQSTPKVSIPSLPDEDNGDDVIKEPVYIVGNSLGGFVALYFAACNPEMVKGVTLLNATPFWGFIPNPERSPRLSRLFPWAGTFPLPSGVRKLIEVLWQKISDPRSIAEILKQVYADHSTDVDEVFCHIIKTTQHPAAAASFASIMFAPRGQLSFKEALSRCQMNNIPICLTYGKEDPWVMPIFGLWVKKQVPDAPYYEISPAGHCPHDEVPEVVNFLLRGWIKNLESNGSVVLPLLDDPKNADYGVTKDLEFSRQGSIKSVRVHFHGSKFSVWNWLSSQFKPLLKSMEYLVSRGVEDVSA
ncbi:hypothetical protein DH2020_025850 [Rehmannia glutinosa]|uniref:AB hydrolase-1 domain-containing protein n=1 Tax=Rehmannia glutinosa TaxID=99300 RepID=A0ABR0VYJ4_REHGL